MSRVKDDDDDGTPCPIRSGNSSDLYFTATPPSALPPGAYDDDTANIEFTKELPSIDAFLSKDTRKKKGLKEPPRRITNYVPPVRPERQERHEQLVVKPARISAEDAQVVALPFGPEQRPQDLQQLPRPSLMGIGAKGPSRRRVSAILKAKHHEQAQDEGRTRASLPELRAARASQELVVNNKSILTDKTRNTPIVKLAQQQLLGGEKKHLQAPPKRMPTVKPQRPKAITGVVRNRNNGKENIPPTPPRERVPGKSPPKKSIRLSDEPIRMPTKKTAPAFKVSVSTASNHVNRSNERSMKRSSDDISFGDIDASFTSQSSGYSDTGGSLRLKKRLKTSIGSLPSPPGFTQEEEAELLPPLESLVSGITSYHPQPNKRRPLDPILTDDLVRCEMYEESWLSAQESSVSQLLNHLLAEYSPTPAGKNRLSLRNEFLAIYSSAPFPIIYNRVHASLLYGALSITQHMLDKSSTSRISRVSSLNSTGQNYGWGADVGAREKFLSLFIGSYEQPTLIAALEVVVGREMSIQPGDSEKKILEEYIERYIVKSEDIFSLCAPDTGQRFRKGPKMGGHGGGDEDRGTPTWLLRRSLLRSLMLIILLDKVKSRGILGGQRLFKKNSSHKSSASVLKALSRLLLPSIGDISKPLSHLNYSLETIQEPLSEYDYMINNLAIDVRDGVRLTRVVEVLLRSKRVRSAEQYEEEEDWPLTIHLQHPATSRAQKMHNVLLALSSLDKAGGNPQHVEAKDIVDGHREKTVGLLWSLLTQWGLELLLDWDAVTKETRRLESQLFPNLSDDSIDMSANSRDHVELLKDWARCIATKHGLVVKNLTTSFADGKVFAAIVHEYEQYLPSFSKENKAMSLEVKLKGIGCNSYFAGLFDSKQNSGRVFNQDFVVAGLAYLCSRLIQPSTQERAAMTIQRAYRNLAFHTNVHKRINLLLLAHGCAEIVKRKSAAITIQRACRRFFRAKVVRVTCCAVRIQSLYRGLVARHNLRASLSAVLLVQRSWREIRENRYRKRIGVAKHAIVGIQAIARGILMRHKFLDLKRKVSMLETHWHTVNLARQAREEYLRMRRAAIIIQKTFCRHSGSRNERAILAETRNCAITIQAMARGYSARLKCLRGMVNVIFIQRWYRQAASARKAKATYSTFRKTAVFIQQRRREIVLARSLRKRFLLLRASITAIKQHYLEKKRTTNAVLVLQRAWRDNAWIVRMRRIRREAVLIQSVWRGYLVRKGACPRLRILLKRIKKSMMKSMKDEDTIGARTKQALAQMKTKAGFSRGIVQLEHKTKLSRECSQIVAADELGLTTILAFIESSVAHILKPSTTVAPRALTAATNTIANIARVPSCCAIIAGRLTPKGSKDIFNVLLQFIEASKAATTNTPLYELFLISMKTLVYFSGTDSIRRRLHARKKWVEKLLTILKAAESAGKRRGATQDQAKTDALRALFAIFGDGQHA